MTNAPCDLTHTKWLSSAASPRATIPSVNSEPPQEAKPIDLDLSNANAPLPEGLRNIKLEPCAR